MLPFQKYRKIMVFDVETTGLVPKKDPITKKMPSIDEMPRIIQLSYIIYNVIEGNISKLSNSYIKLEDPTQLSPFITELTGITADTLNERGIDIIDALTLFYNDFITVDCVIAHNIKFDSQLILIEIERYYEHLEKTIPQILNLFNPIFLNLKKIDLYCTMQSSIHICNILVPSTTNPEKTYKKFPKLSELYKWLFKMDAVQLHNSLIDTIYTLRCFLKIKLHIELHSVKFNHMIDNANRII